MPTPDSAAAFDATPNVTGIILVDHGSRREESNRLLLDVVEAYRRHSGWPIVEAAHMELAEPTIATAFGRCVEQGARLVVVFPYLLSPGRHWDQDIPRLAAEAAIPYARVRYLVTGPLGLHPLILEVIDERIAEGLGGDHRPTAQRM
jgi:sirohydrochlorin ferrochelatase